MDPRREGRSPPNKASPRLAPASSTRTRHSVASVPAPNSPKAFTSFPSFSPEPNSPAPANAKADGKAQSAHPLSKDDSNDFRPRSQSASVPVQIPPATGASAFDRTMKGAANLRKAIIATLTNSSTTVPEASKIVFDQDGSDDTDPLHQATDEQVQRLIENKGGAVATVRQFSADVAESNARVATERNGKQVILEENRHLREENEHLKLINRELEERLERATSILKRLVGNRKQRALSETKFEVVESPVGPFLLDTGTGQVVKDLPDSQEVGPRSSDFSPASTSITDNSQAIGSLQALTSAAKSLKESSKDTPVTATRKSAMRRSMASPRLKSETLEMSVPIEEEELPPSLRPPRRSDRLGQIDRLGFLFTANREQRHNEALLLHKRDPGESSSLDSFPVQDDDGDVVMKTPKSSQNGDFDTATLGTRETSDGELLCYAPIGPPLRLVSFGSKGEQKFIDILKSGPVEAQTAETNVTSRVESTDDAASDTETTLPTRPPLYNPKDRESEGARALGSLLAKLNESYDSQQARRLSEWKAFETHVRSVVRRSHEENHAEYAMLGIASLCSPSTASPEILKRFNTMIVLGVPVIMRKEIWMEKTGANALKTPGAYASYLNEGEEDPGTLHEIAADVERTLANNIFFREGIGRGKLRDVLIAYSRHNNSIGYSQGLNIIAANLLLLVPTAEDAFWLLVAVIDNVLPYEYYHRSGAISGVALETDGNVLLSYVNDLLPKLHKHLASFGVSLTMFTPGWFISAFAACLSGEPLYRSWDILFGFCDGRYIFCFALALLKVNRKGLFGCETNEEVMLYLGGKMTNAAVSLDVLVREALSFTKEVTVEDLKSRRSQFAVPV